MTQTRAAGWVYVLRSIPYPGIVKIGATSRHAQARIGELDRARGYRAFGPWSEVRSVAVPDIHRVEAVAHRMLAHKRVRLNRHSCRELFRANPSEACEIVVVAALSLDEQYRRPNVWHSNRAAPIGAARRALACRRPRQSRWSLRLLSAVVCVLIAWVVDPDIVVGLARCLAAMVLTLVEDVTHG